MKISDLNMRRIKLNSTRLALPAAAVLTFLLGGCVVGPKYHAPATQAPAEYKEAPAPSAPTPAPPQSTNSSDPTIGGLGGWSVAQPSDAALRGSWWEVYNDPELNALEEQLNTNNLSIKQSYENFMAARAMIREARSQLFPTASVTPSWTRSRSSANSAPTAVVTTAKGVQATLINLPAEISWEPDLWGKVRNSVRQAQFQAQLSAADLANVRLSQQATLATYFFELRGQDALRQVLDNTVAADQKSLDLARAQYETGISDQIAVVQAQATLESAQAQATNTGLLRAQYEHAIAVLVGKAASEFSIPVKPLLITPPPLPISVPSKLLERRPDIAASERTMAAANAEIGIAYAAYYPNLTLSASGGFSSSTWKHLLDIPSRFWSIGPSISETVFDAGLRRATIHQYVAVYNADLAGYRQTVLTAFQQVEDALASLRVLSQQIQQQRQAVEFNQRALDLELQRYESGIDPYIDVVIQQNSLLASQQILTEIEIQRTTASVQLIEALGGGWDRSQLPTVEQITQKPTQSETALQH